MSFYKIFQYIIGYIYSSKKIVVLNFITYTMLVVIQIGFLYQILIGMILYYGSFRLTKVFSDSYNKQYSKMTKIIISSIVLFVFISVVVLIGVDSKTGGFLGLFIFYGVYTGLAQTNTERNNSTIEENRLIEIKLQNELFNSVYLNNKKTILICGYCKKELNENDLIVEEGNISRKYYCPECTAKNIIIEN